jgi:hypothetical protein
MNKPRLPQLYSKGKQHYTIIWVYHKTFQVGRQIVAISE